MKRVRTEEIPETMWASVKFRGGNSKSPEAKNNDNNNNCFWKNDNLKENWNCFFLEPQTVRVTGTPVLREKDVKDTDIEDVSLWLLSSVDESWWAVRPFADTTSLLRRENSKCLKFRIRTSVRKDKKGSYPRPTVKRGKSQRGAQ